MQKEDELRVRIEKLSRNSSCKYKSVFEYEYEFNRIIKGLYITVQVVMGQRFRKFIEFYFLEPVQYWAYQVIVDWVVVCATGCIILRAFIGAV